MIYAELTSVHVRELSRMATIRYILKCEEFYKQKCKIIYILKYF